MSYRAITATQRSVLDFVRSSIEKRGISPTLREICEHFGWSSLDAARAHVAALKRKGALRITPRVPRGIVLGEQHAHNVAAALGATRTALATARAGGYRTESLHDAVQALESALRCVGDSTDNAKETT